MPKGRIAALLAVCLTAGMLLAGCGGGSEQGSGDVAAPKNEGKLVIYCPHQMSLIKPVVAAFEEESGIKTEVIRAGTGELLQRLEAEKDAPQCDVLWGGTFNSVKPYQELFADYCSANDAAMQPAFKNSGPFNWYSDLPSVIMVNTNLIGDIRVEGYADVLNPALQGRIAMADPGKSSAAYEHLVNMLYAMGRGNPDAGWDYVAAFCASLQGQLLPSSYEVYKSVADGNNVVGLTFEEGAAKCMADGAPVQVIYMGEGVITDPDGVFVMKGAKRREAAEKFVDFVTSKKSQEMLVQQLHRRSVRADVPQPDKLPAKDKVNFITDDKAVVSASKAAWIERFHKLYDNAR